MFQSLLVFVSFSLCSFLTHAAPVPEALNTVGQILIAASKNPEIKKYPGVYEAFEKAYLLAEQLYYQYPHQIVLVEPGTALNKNYCPNQRFGFAHLTVFSSRDDRPVKSMRMNDIYLCPHSQRVSSSDLAQIISHEIFHSIGWLNECDATYLELTAQRLASRSANFNAYVYGCGHENIATYKAVEYPK